MESTEADGLLHVNTLLPSVLNIYQQGLAVVLTSASALAFRPIRSSNLTERQDQPHKLSSGNLRVLGSRTYLKRSASCLRAARVSHRSLCNEFQLEVGRGLR